jgi:CHAT domain-containing protein/Flp pilus assembly protein TadD
VPLNPDDCTLTAFELFPNEKRRDINQLKTILTSWGGLIGRFLVVKIELSTAFMTAPQQHEESSVDRMWFRNKVPKLISFMLLACVSCSRRGNPQAALDHAIQTFHHGDLAAATAEVEAGYKEFHTVSNGWAWKFRILQADVLTWRGMSDNALNVLTSEEPPSDELKLQKQWVEASALTSLLRFAEAEQKLQDFERLCALSDYPICSDLRARGWLDLALGRFEEARLLFAKTLTMARSQSDRFVEANALLCLSAVALQQEHFDDALSWADVAYQQSTGIDAGSVAQVALGNEGWAYYRLGDSEKALGLFLEATNRAHQIGAAADEVKWLTTAGYVYLDAHDYDKAQQSYQYALDLAQKINSKEDILNALMSLALLSERTGKLEEARDYADKTIALAPAEGNRLDVLYPMLVKGRVAARLHETDQAEKTFREIERDPKSHVFLKWEAEHSLAQLYEDNNKPDLADREYRAALSTFETARSSLQHEESSLPFPANALRIYDDYIHFLVGRGRAAEALQVAEYSRGRTLAEGLGLLQKGTSFKPDVLAAPAIARRAGGAILFYWLGEKQSYLWAITPQATSLFQLPATSEIDAMVKKYRRALEKPQDVGESPDGLALFRTLVEPASKVLAKQAKVYIVADGSLNSLNFEALLVPDTKPHYWIEDVTVANASSLRLLNRSRAGVRAGAPNLLLVGNPVAAQEYGALPQAATEVAKIREHFPPNGQQNFTEGQATPAAYLGSKPERFSYIHFVAHGTASRLSPLDSAIVLSQSGSKDDSFKLYARDIIQHPLRADLVTISACYGAGTRAYSGEGLVGLSWAFLRAGAHNVVGALWEVSDASTPRLMDQMYAEIGKGRRPEEALRLAKLSLLHSNDSFRRPFYWATFQFYTGS